MPGKPLKAKHALLLVPYALALIVSAIYLRGQSVWISALLPIVLGVFYWLILQKIQIRSFSALIGLSLLFRLLVIWGLPTLSDDFYRFLWDGWLWLEGVNPFTQTPEQVADSFSLGAMQEAWLNNMNSPSYYTVYPPLHQAVFIVGAWVADLGGSLAGVQAMRAIIVLGELVLIYRLWVLHRTERLRVHPAYYAFNPLVILEISGNLHFEGLVVLFLLLAFFSSKSLAKGSWLAISVGVKLLPLILIPALVFRKKLRQSLYLLSGFAVVSLVIWLPVISLNTEVGPGESLSLYFGNFEFNASVFKLVNSLVSEWIGYNAIGFSAPVMALLSFLLILGISSRKESGQFWKFTMVWWAFLLLSASVHPWYVIPLVFLGFFCLKNSAMYWSVAILWSYLFYLLPNGFWIVQVVEYAGLALILVPELRSALSTSGGERGSHS